ncbi:hypothetical protein GCM10022247_39680 [Allokutzneria multivorans]|uniref:Immunity protein Imm1 n=1 Tax=Allokutzneria multivorans TaxID=1142134 RepID=A0ABP7SKN4_9PSEU
MTSRVEAVLSAVLDNHMRYARSSEEITALVRQAVDVVHPDWPTLLYLWDRPCTSEEDDGEEGYPGHQLKVSTDPANGWGALHFITENPDAVQAWETLNPEPSDAAPELLFDAAADSVFGREAALPIETIRVAVTEFVATGQRPESVRWQPSMRV